ncbi:MAG: hypothetical protein KBA61_09880 [Spirochaetes bacterium]|nr:hypothetical protein [Spirochaetota bacterium]
MYIDDENKCADIRKELDAHRERWRAVRNERLALKRELEAGGADAKAVRGNKNHRRLRKEQDHLATLMRHMEKRLNRKRANLAKQDKP